MARSKTTPVRSTLRGVLGPQRIQAAAKKHKVVRRQRKLNVFLLVWTLVLGFQVGAARTLTGLRQTYQRAAGHSLAPSAFYGRLNGRMAKLLYRLVQDTLAAQPDGAHRWRSLVVPPRSEENAETPRGRRSAWIPWATLMKRTFGLDVLLCRRCGGRMELRALVRSHEVSRKLLRMLGLPWEPEQLAPAEAPVRWGLEPEFW